MKLLKSIQKNNQKRQWIINSVKRRSNILKHNLYINNIETKLKIIWLKSKNDIDTILAPINKFNYEYSYFINAVLSYDNFNYNYSYDIVVLNLMWEVTNTFKNASPNSISLNFEHLSHIIVLPVNGIEQLSINIGDYVRPMPKII